MSFKDLTIKQNYESKTDNIIDDFYIPVLKASNQYDRIAGFFTSSSLMISLRGIEGLINNGGKIRLLISPRLTEEDAKVMEEAKIHPHEFLSKKMIFDVENIIDDYEKNYIFSLGWLIANEILDIKVIILKSEGRILSSDEIERRGILHLKVGVFRDSEKNVLSFSGSINETFAAWTQNIEEFKTFKSWEEQQKDYCLNDVQKFETYWNNSSLHAESIPIPDVFKKYLIQNCPENPQEFYSIKRYLSKNKTDREISLYPYQKEGYKKWIQNDYKLLFEMATGTGKTRTAIACIKHFLSQSDEAKIVIIATPQTALSMQWEKEIEKLSIIVDQNIFADSSNYKWEKEIEKIMLELKVGYISNAIVYTTHDTASKDNFINVIKKYCMNIKTLFVGDEVHALGTPKRKSAMLEEYQARIGLSATPSRWFDEYGTKLIEDYFGKNKFVFGISEALSTINPLTNQTFLAQFKYYPVPIRLTYEEIEEYNRITKKLVRFSGREDDEFAEVYEYLLNERARIHKQAANKVPELVKLIKTIKDIKNMLIFSSYAHITDVLRILHDHSIVGQKITQSESPDERTAIINDFKKGRYQVLVAIKCLDEGIDIPEAETAIIMESSTNPREYIQRIGRVIRQSNTPKTSKLYDMIVVPDITIINNELKEIEMKIFDKEINRVMEISKHALNNADVYEAILHFKNGGSR